MKIGSQPKRHTIIAHDHNIPCIKFSPCGNFIASISIDKSCRIHHVKTKKLIAKIEFGFWLWSIVWIRKKDISGLDAPNIDYIDKFKN